MEASGTGGQQGQAAGQGEGEGAAAQQDGAQDYGALAQQLGTMASGQEEIRQFLQSQPWQQQQEPGEPEQQIPELDLSALTDDPQYAQEVAKGLTGYFDQMWQQREQAFLKDHVEPAKELAQQVQRGQEFRDLVREFPDLNNVETVQEVLKHTGALASMTGHDDLSNHPAIVKLVYMAGRGAEMANQETDENAPPAHLEGGGGAGPGAAQQGGMTAADIVNARRGASALPFSP